MLVQEISVTAVHLLEVRAKHLCYEIVSWDPNFLKAFDIIYKMVAFL